MVDVCGEIAGNISDPIRVNTDTLHLLHHKYNLNTNKSATDTVQIISIGSLATPLIVSIVIFTTVIAIIFRRSKAKNKAALQQSNRLRDGTICIDSMYADITGPSPLVGVSNTADNIAYGHTHTTQKQTKQ